MPCKVPDLQARLSRSASGTAKHRARLLEISCSMEIEMWSWQKTAQLQLCATGSRKGRSRAAESPQCSYAFLAGYMTQGTRVAQEKLLIPSSAMDKAPQWFHTVLYGKRTFVQICSNSFHHCRYMRVQLR